LVVETTVIAVVHILATVLRVVEAACTLAPTSTTVTVTLLSATIALIAVPCLLLLLLLLLTIPAPILLVTRLPTVIALFNVTPSPLNATVTLFVTLLCNSLHLHLILFGNV
jgi:hypothetical protein